jgi:hypothetical protein
MSPCKTIAAPMGKRLAKSPMRISPPNMPKILDKKAVPRLASTIIAAISPMAYNTAPRSRS